MKHLVIFALVFIFLGCNDGIVRPNKPDNLIPEDKMVDIMCDVYLLNSAKGVNRKTLEQHGIFPENYVFEKYGIDSTQFANSSMYYTYDTKTYESILERIKDKLNDQKKAYENLEKAEEDAKRKRSDSLRKALARQKDSLNRPTMPKKVTPQENN